VTGVAQFPTGRTGSGRRWSRRRQSSRGVAAAPRTWFRKTSDGTFFRNCPLIMQERERAVDAQNWPAVDRLDAEWHEVFWRGVATAEEIDPGDTWIEHDDSPEATEEWVQQLLAGRIEEQMRGGKTT
jgi:hypothetical protein